MIMEKIIKLAEVISTDIRSRANAEILKNQISSGNDIMLDFEGVTFISRSFADELYNLTEHVNANVGMCNMCPLVKNMLAAVADGRSKKRVHNVTDDDIYICNDMESLSRILLA
jgi:hypothetical protein